MFLFVVSVFSQEKQDSLQFTFSKLSFQLRVVDFMKFSDFQGGSISLKYHLGNKNALRVGIGVTNNKNNYSLTYLDTEADTIRKDMEDNRSYYNYEIYTQYIIYPHPESDIKFYFGAGPYISWKKSKSEMERWDDTERKNKLYESNEMKTIAIGLDFVAGVEWFFMKSMSLLADYNFSAEYYELTRKSTTYPPWDTVKREEKASYYFLRTGTAKIGLSIYF